MEQLKCNTLENKAPSGKKMLKNHSQTKMKILEEHKRSNSYNFNFQNTSFKNNNTSYNDLSNIQIQTQPNVHVAINEPKIVIEVLNCYNESKQSKESKEFQRDLQLKNEKTFSINYFKLEQIKTHLEKFMLENKSTNNNACLTINYEII